MLLTPTSQPDFAPKRMQRLAVLIDAENAPAAAIAPILGEVAKFGRASVKRVYGDWTSPNMSSWKRSLLEHSLAPIQQFAYTTGKNASDCALIIDAMDLMYSHRFDGFCLVSSDSDFTRLAQRLREEGLNVYGFGEQKTPVAFVEACDEFVRLEVLRRETPTPLPNPPLGSPSALAPSVAGIEQAIRAAGRPDWAHLGAVGHYLQRIQPGFHPRLLGARKLSDVLRRYPTQFELEERGEAGTPNRPMYVRAVGRA